MKAISKEDMDLMFLTDSVRRNERRILKKHAVKKIRPQLKNL